MVSNYMAVFFARKVRIDILNECTKKQLKTYSLNRYKLLFSYMK
jgi:hypothetical protein